MGGIAGEAGDALGVMGNVAKGVARAAVPDELYQRVGAEAPNIADMIKRGVGNPGAIPVDPNDRPL